MIKDYVVDDSDSTLFDPIEIGGLVLANRIVVSPMSQFSAQSGAWTAWHAMHYGSLAQSGAGLLTLEATAVAPEGRVTYGDAGLWTPESESVLADLLERIRAVAETPVAIQLNHAGRKASTQLPWLGREQLPPDGVHGWQTVSATSAPFRAVDLAPQRMSVARIAETVRQFTNAARRAVRAGVDAIQIHAAHGYLLHQFLSPLSNDRDDEYGGSFENRARFPLEVFRSVADVVQSSCPVTVRVSASDWVDGGWNVADAARFARLLEDNGCAAVEVTTGGLDAAQQISIAPGYQVEFAAAIRREVAIPVSAGGMIEEFDHAAQIVSSGQADLVYLGRPLLRNPRWPWFAAQHLGGQITIPDQYIRSIP